MIQIKRHDDAALAAHAGTEQIPGAHGFDPPSGGRSSGQLRRQHPATPDLYDIKQTAKYLNSSVSSVRRRIKESALPAFKMNGKIQIDGRDLRRFMEAHRVEATSMSEPDHG